MPPFAYLDHNATSPLRPAAYLIKGRALAMQKNWGEAITVLTRYRAGAEKYLNAGPVTEEGLVRLADAYAASGNWAESRATYENLIGRFGGSKWVPDARFGMELVDFTEDFRASSFKVFSGAVANGGVVKALNAKGLAGAQQLRASDQCRPSPAVPHIFNSTEYVTPRARRLRAARSALRLTSRSRAASRTRIGLVRRLLCVISFSRLNDKRIP